MKLWDVATGKEQSALQANTLGVWSPDGKSIASAGNDQTVWRWDAATGKERRLLRLLENEQNGG